MNKLELARQLAIDAHEGQIYGDGPSGIHPYIYHLEQTVTLLKNIGCDDEILLCAMVLHDTLEDTSLSYSYLKTKMGIEVADRVSELTHDNADSYMNYIYSIAWASPWNNYNLSIILLKLIDNLCNLRQSIKGQDIRRIEKYNASISYLKCACIKAYGVRYTDDTETMLHSILVKLNTLKEN